jgi:hypothetical protein
VFRPTDKECDVCNEVRGNEMKFPAKDCEHYFCVQCSRDLLLFDESRYHLSREPFGCPPCPNGCTNPIKGRQCYCYEYQYTIMGWEEVYPEKFIRWDEAELKSIKDRDNSAYGSCCCPICRRQFVFSK